MQNPSPLPLDHIWQKIRQEIEVEAKKEPILASFLHTTILNHNTLEASLSFHLAHKLNSQTTPALLVREVIEEALGADENIGCAVRRDIHAFAERDSACGQYSTAFLYYKGFLALQTYRVANWLWKSGRRSLALFFQNLVSQTFAVDIHPAAQIGSGIFLDHATGLVVGETAVVEDYVSIMQSVTLGGTGKESGDRHPKIGKGVLIGAGAKILGNIAVGEGSQIAAGSVVLKPVPAHTMIAGVPGKEVGKPQVHHPALDMNHSLICGKT